MPPAKIRDSFGEALREIETCWRTLRAPSSWFNEYCGQPPDNRLISEEDVRVISCVSRRDTLCAIGCLRGMGVCRVMSVGEINDMCDAPARLVGRILSELEQVRHQAATQRAQVVQLSDKALDFQARAQKAEAELDEARQKIRTLEAAQERVQRLEELIGILQARQVLD